MSDEKKIIIDDDWKSQVAAEKEALKKDVEEPQPASEPAQDASASGEASPQMPPATFEMLVTTLATEAMIAMGQFPNPANQELTVSPEQASYAIDMLAMLKEKTKGNLTTEEDTMITDMLHQLRMMFITVQGQSPSA